MKLGLLGRKIGMTQIFDANGNVVPVTVLSIGPCTVVEKRVKNKNGYEAVQLGYEVRNAAKVKKPLKTYFAKKKLDCFRHLKEFRVAPVDQFQIGQVMTVAGFEVGDIVDVEGETKGRGFQGVMKKEGKHGGPDSHGSDFHRRPGSIGMRTWPGRVLKNMGMPGHMGSNQVLMRKLIVVDVQPEKNLLLVRGAVPGANKGLVVIYNRKEDFPARFVTTTKEEAATQEETPSA